MRFKELEVWKRSFNVSLYINKLIIELEEINKMLAGYINYLNRSRD